MMQTIVSIALPILIAVILAYWKWQAERTKKQERRLKAVLLGVQWLMEKAEQKPNTYISTMMAEALKDD